MFTSCLSALTNSQPGRIAQQNLASTIRAPSATLLDFVMYKQLSTALQHQGEFVASGAHYILHWKSRLFSFDLFFREDGLSEYLSKHRVTSSSSEWQISGEKRKLCLTGAGLYASRFVLGDGFWWKRQKMCFLSSVSVLRPARLFMSVSDFSQSLK